MTTFRFEHVCTDPNTGTFHVGPVEIGVTGGVEGNQVVHIQALLDGNFDGKRVILSNCNGVSGFSIDSDRNFYVEGGQFGPMIGDSVSFSIPYDDHKEEVDKFLRFVIAVEYE